MYGFVSREGVSFSSFILNRNATCSFRLRSWLVCIFNHHEKPVSIMFERPLRFEMAMADFRPNSFFKLAARSFMFMQFSFKSTFCIDFSNKSIPSHFLLDPHLADGNKVTSAEALLIALARVKTASITWASMSWM